MRIITANVNGIRAAGRKGFFSWLEQQKADVVCLQELKAQPNQIEEPLYYPTDYHCFYHHAERRGYSGVGLYGRREPLAVKHGIGWEDIDVEGRYLEARFPSVAVVSLYMHSGSGGEHRQQVKFGFMERFLPYLRELRDSLETPLVICGDWNIVHREIDIRNWKSNQKNSGCLPEERAWLTKLFDEAGFVDAFRVVHPETPDLYTWWSNRGQAWAKNVGWRIDYQITSADLGEKAQSATVYRDERFSDHAPLTMDYDWEF